MPNTKWGSEEEARHTVAVSSERLGVPSLRALGERPQRLLEHSEIL
jgi:hypothetical protein